MRRLKAIAGLAAFFLLGFAVHSPAPFVYRPGIGWTYEAVGSEGTWIKFRAKDELDVAQAAFDKKDYSLAARAAQYLVAQWPLSDHAPRAEYLLGRCHEEMGQNEKAFNEYQRLLEKYPKATNYQEVMDRQFAICNRFLNGERFKLWGLIPLYTSMDKTVDMYEKMIKNGPYADVSAQAQLNIGAAREKQSRFLNDNEPYMQAARAYEVAADRYRDRPAVAAEAVFKQGLAYAKEARKAEYDQATAEKAVSTLVEFMTWYPDDPRVKEAQRVIDLLKAEQALGNFKVARFYESRKQWLGARVYYNEVVSRSPDSPYKELALQRLAELQKRIQSTGP